MEHLWFRKTAECQGRFRPNCDPEGLAVPQDGQMFVLECLLCLIRAGGGELKTGRLDASTE